MLRRILFRCRLFVQGQPAAAPRRNADDHNDELVHEIDAIIEEMRPDFRHRALDHLPGTFIQQIEAYTARSFIGNVKTLLVKDLKSSNSLKKYERCLIRCTMTQEERALRRAEYSAVYARYVAV